MIRYTSLTTDPAPKWEHGEVWEVVFDDPGDPIMVLMYKPKEEELK